MKHDFLYCSNPARVSAMILVAALGLGGCRSGGDLSRNNLSIRNPEGTTNTHPALRALDFMTGSWRAVEDEEFSEELWSVAHGNSMAGTFRMAGVNGALNMQEVLAIVAEPDGVYMRLRHFDAKMVSREEKDAPIVLKLEAAGGQRAVFRCISGSKSLASITNWRVEQTLHSEIAFTPESKRETLKFEMRRLGTYPH